MHFDRLRYFVVVAETGSIRRAAEQLRLSAAALSQAIAKLEEELGCQLLSRQGRGIVITDAGRRLVIGARRWLDDASRLRATARGEDAPERLRLGTFEPFSTHALPQLLPPFGSEPPEIYEYGPGALEEAVRLLRVDIGLTYLPIGAQGVSAQALGTVKMDIVARKDCFRGTAFEEIPFVAPLAAPGAAPTRVEGLDGWPDARKPRKVRYRVALLESALALCRDGLCAAFVPRFVVREHNRHVAPTFQLTPIASAPQWRAADVTAYLVTRSGEEDSPVARRLAMAVRRLLRASETVDDEEKAWRKNSRAKSGLALRSSIRAPKRKRSNSLSNEPRLT